MQTEKKGEGVVAPSRVESADSKTSYQKPTSKYNKAEFHQLYAGLKLYWEKQERMQRKVLEKTRNEVTIAFHDYELGIQHPRTVKLTPEQFNERDFYYLVSEFDPERMLEENNSLLLRQ